MTASPLLTYSNLTTPPRGANWLMRPVGWPFFVVCAAATAWILWKARLPGVVLETEYVYLGAPLAAFWVLRAGLRLLLWRIYRQPWPLHWRQFRSFAIALWFPILVVGLPLIHIPEGAALFASRSVFRRLANEALTTDTLPSTPLTAGLFTVEEINRGPLNRQIVHFYVRSNADLPSGFAYCVEPPGMMDEFFGGCHYQHLYGRWYRITRTARW